MTHRENVLNLLAGNPVDRLLWSPRLKEWYTAHQTQGTLPDRYRGKSLVEIETMLGAVAGSSARISWNQRKPQPKGQIIDQRFQTVEIETTIEGNHERVTYKTPVGSATETYLINVEAVEKGLPMQRHRHEHLIKSEKDYDIVEYMYRDIAYTPTYDGYLAFEQALGDHGVPIINLDRDPMYLIMQNLVGYNLFFYEFYDHRPRIDRLYEVICTKFEEATTLVLDSPATLMLAAYHHDGTMMSPAFYNEYMKPYLQPFAAELRKRGKYLGTHADADTRGLFKEILESDITFIDCFATSPIVPTTFEEAVEAWEDEVVIYGGVPSNILIPSICSESDFDACLNRTFRTIKEKPCRVLLGVADNVMPEADMGRVEKVARMVEEFPATVS